MLQSIINFKVQGKVTLLTVPACPHPWSVPPSTPHAPLRVDLYLNFAYLARG